MGAFKMSRFYYYKSISGFLADEDSAILGSLARSHNFTLVEQQRNSWFAQILLLKRWLKHISGHIIFEYSIPRMGKRIDCVVISDNTIFAIEFKVGASTYNQQDIDQVTDYALDLKNFHEISHNKTIVPILICTDAKNNISDIEYYEDKVSSTVLINGESLAGVINSLSNKTKGKQLDVQQWINSPYKPTPTIIEAAQALYRNHDIREISRSDAGAINLSKTSRTISDVINFSKNNSKKSICFITGVPGSGKTLAGLNLASSWHDVENSEHAVFLSGNGPLVNVLREALARNEVKHGKENGIRIKKKDVLSRAKVFIQNIHHFRDYHLANENPPLEHVVVFDEAQRAWNLKQTSSFMKTKKGMIDFNMSEPEFLIGVMDRHSDWATIICLVGGGQEINTGEAGLQEWFDSLNRSFSNWNIYVSHKLSDSEYIQDEHFHDMQGQMNVSKKRNLHLSVSVRSYRSECVSDFVKATLDCDLQRAKELYRELSSSYPLLMTRKLDIAKKWLINKARGSERYGLVASSSGMRLKPFGINMKFKINPCLWFLNDKSDIRSSYYLEDTASEFDIQGLELDWTCVAWDADLRFNSNSWQLKSFKGASWQNVCDENRRRYLVNAYRVLLTRARQGMVIFIPHGSREDKTRQPSFYDSTYEYFKSLGIQEIDNSFEPDN